MHLRLRANKFSCCIMFMFVSAGSVYTNSSIVPLYRQYYYYNSTTVLLLKFATENLLMVWAIYM